MRNLAQKINIPTYIYFLYTRAPIVEIINTCTCNTGISIFVLKFNNIQLYIDRMVN